ncbi:MAG: ABC transporter substrate-binding protein [Lentisphaerae bacterium]|nr:ABC transporter substrate-binding protein [Lentisphaerota bacterium]MCP4101932.1 ABC transporter substrate-binding protein [Lentisphaerota bacterium]
MLRTFIALLLLLALNSYAHKISPENNDYKKVSLTLQWFPQAQFAGYYMALQKGFYKKKGLIVELRHKKPYESIFDLLKNKKTDFITVFLSTAIKAQCKGLPLVNIGQISQKSALVFVARKDSGIKSIKDMNGRKVGIWTVDFKVIPEVLLMKNKVKAKIVPILSDADLFLWHGVDVLTTMWYNEYHMILNAGINEDELSTFFFSDYNLDIPEDGIYCLKEYWKKNPEVCKKLLEATLEGWHAAFNNKKQAVELVHKYCREGYRPFNVAHQRWMLNKMEKLIFPKKKDYYGKLAPAAFRKTAKILKIMGVIDHIPRYNDFCKIAESFKQER